MAAPHPDDLELPHDVSAPRLARRHSAALLDRWHARGLTEPVLLVVSELVTNAVIHGRPPLRLALRRMQAAVRIEVADADPELPEAVRPDLASESGRGRFLVRSVAADAGVHKVPGDGKITWAVVCPDDQAPGPEG
jgi:anti-sigma regulatory factor (Ser/Thr protein kinase)